MELAVFGALERSRPRGFGRGVGVKRGKTVHRRVVNRRPISPKLQMIGVQISYILARNIRVGHARVEDDWLSRPADHLQSLKLPALLQIGGTDGNEPVHEAVRLLAVRVHRSRFTADILN